jgi:hypothetical protein
MNEKSAILIISSTSTRRYLSSHLQMNGDLTDIINANVIGDVDVLGPIQDLHREVPGSY